MSRIIIRGLLFIEHNLQYVCNHHLILDDTYIFFCNTQNLYNVTNLMIDCEFGNRLKMLYDEKILAGIDTAMS